MLAGNGFNIKPSGKSWGKAKPMLKNIYVSFVMDGTCATLDLVLFYSLYSGILYGASSDPILSQNLGGSPASAQVDVWPG